MWENYCGMGGGGAKGMLAPPPELFGWGGQRVCSPPGPPVPLFLRLCSLPNIYFSSDTVCLATVYPEREREREKETERVNDENYHEKRERERERERERCSTSRCTERSEVKDKRQKLMKIPWERENVSQF